MWRIIYANDRNRVLLLCGSEEYAKNFLIKGKYKSEDYIIQEII